MDKRGISDIITTALITLLSILAILLVVFSIYKFAFSDFVSLDSLNLDDFKIEVSYNNNSVGSSSINQVRTMETIYISISRGRDDVNLSGLNFVFYVDGGSYSCKRTHVPGQSESSVYAFQSPIFAKQLPERISVFPLVGVDGNEKTTRSGFSTEKISSTHTIFDEKVNECGGFCCEDNVPEAPVEISSL